jgi:plastocyanin
MRQSILWLVIFLLAGAVSARADDSKADIYGKVTILSTDKKPVGDNSGAIVFIRKVHDNKGFTAPQTEAVMASQDMQFVPEVLPILTGTTVSFPNMDNMDHNAFSVSKSKPFDLGTYGKGKKKTVVFKTPGVVNVDCNMHPAMAGYIMVLGNPYFTVTDDAGNFVIKNVPKGSYKLVCWFPYGFIEETAVDLSKAAAAKFASQDLNGVEADFELTKLRDENRHKNKFGKEYNK